MKSQNSDTKAILERREMFIKQLLSEQEMDEVKGGALISPKPCLTIIKDPVICLSIIGTPIICLSIIPPTISTKETE